MTLAELFAWLYREKFTGTLVLHFRRGSPHAAEYGRPNRIDFRPETSSTLPVQQGRDLTKPP